MHLPLGGSPPPNVLALDLEERVGMTLPVMLSTCLTLPVMLALARVVDARECREADTAQGTSIERELNPDLKHKRGQSYEEPPEAVQAKQGVACTTRTRLILGPYCDKV